MIGQHIDNEIASHEIFGDPERMHAVFATVRREDPLHWTQAEGYPGFWFVSKHADLMQIGRNNQQFINDPASFLQSLEEERIARAENAGRTSYGRTIVNMDEPEHRVYRGLTQAWFMPANIKRLDAVIQTQARRMVDRMQELGGRCDFVHEIAGWYPLRVIMTLLGVPEEDHPMLLRLTQQGLAPRDPTLKYTEHDGELSSNAAVVKGFFEYFSGVLADRRAHPRDDLSTVIAQSCVDGQPIGQMEALSYFLILATAGHDTTASAVSGGLEALISHPEEFAKLRANPDLLNSAIEEILRWVSPVRHFMRTATTDCTIRDKTIRNGDLVLLSYPSANMDEEVFSDPHVFRIDRRPNRHMAFGFGVHACLGQNLARAELRAFFQELLRRVDPIELDGQVQWVLSNQVSGPKSMVLRYAIM